MSGNEPIQAASETDPPRQIHSQPMAKHAALTAEQTPWQKGSAAPNRRSDRKSGSASKMIAPTTAKESWKPVEKTRLCSNKEEKTPPLPDC